MAKYANLPRRVPTDPVAPKPRPPKGKYTIVHNNYIDNKEIKAVGEPDSPVPEDVTRLRPTTFTTLNGASEDKGRNFGDESRTIDKLVFDALLCLTNMTSRREDEITFERWRWATPDVYWWKRA